MLTLFITWPLGDITRTIDIKGSDTLGRVKQLVAAELGVPIDSFTMYSEGEELEDDKVPVSQTLLVEGSTVEARPSKGFEARRELASMGLTCSGEVFYKVMIADDIVETEEEKARVARLMIDCGTEVKFDRALRVAARRGFLEVARVIAPRCNLMEPPSARATSALHSACATGHTQLVRLLLDHHAKISALDGEHETPLHGAAYNGHTDIVRILLAHEDTDINWLSYNGCTALHLAAESGHSEVVSLLLTHGAKQVQDLWGSTPLHYAAYRGRLEAARVLLSHGACTDTRDREGRDPLQAAGGHPDVATLIAVAMREA